MKCGRGRELILDFAPLKLYSVTNLKTEKVRYSNMKKLIPVLLALCLIAGLAACGSTPAAPATDVPATDVPATDVPATDTPATEELAAEKSYVIGICQLVQHDALDAATAGFRDAVTAGLGADNVRFDEQNASGDSATCSTICNQFVSEKVDLIMANATPALQAAAASTNEIPILGTSVTDYATALEIAEADWTGHTGTNISGTSDLAPLAEQADMFPELLPDVHNIGILYCSAEANSEYQANVVEQALKDLGYSVKRFTFADSNDLANVTNAACAECDALYVPTDNAVAAYPETVKNVATPAGVPIICGEENIAKGCGIAALTISYYDLGFATGEMAAEILLNGADVSTMDIRKAPVTKKYNAEICAELGITVPDGYIAIG